MSDLKYFETDIKNKKYTKCELGKIIGSDACKSCNHFKDKLCENKFIEDENGKKINVVSIGYVECDKSKTIKKSL